MKTNIKALQLVEKGLSSKTISNLTESQIDILHKKMIGEQQITNTKIANTIKNLDVLKLKADEVGTKMKNIGLFVFVQFYILVFKHCHNLVYLYLSCLQIVDNNVDLGCKVICWQLQRRYGS